MEYPHRPVMPNEVLNSLVTRLAGIYVDGTVGTGGHSETIGKKVGKEGRLICLDCDSEAVKISKKRLLPIVQRVSVIKSSYSNIQDVLGELGIEKVHGIMLDLGMSSYQLDNSGRGFSFNRDEWLDMRMDPEAEITAHQLINELPKKKLEKIIKEYGEERKARAVVKAISRERERRSIDTTAQLAKIIQSVIPPRFHHGSKHPATRTFQALRIAVNGELENLRRFLDIAPSLIIQGGRLVILSYHSLEDRMVKHTMAGWEKGCTCPPDLPRCACGKSSLFKLKPKKGIKPSQHEVEENPRSRSAVLRVAERI